MTREEIVELRRRLLLGDPPYEIEPVMGKMTRKKGGVAGLHELKAIGDYGAGASASILALETCLQLIDHILEKAK